MANRAQNLAACFAAALSVLLPRALDPSVRRGPALTDVRVPASGWIEPNQGQFVGTFGYFGRLGPLRAAFHDTRVELAGPDGHRTTLRFNGAHASPSRRLRERLSAYSNYYRGNDPARWRTHVARYRRLVYENVWDGIDVAFYERDGQLEYDFVLHPGANPDDIDVSIVGDTATVVRADEVVTGRAPRQLRHRALVAFQNTHRDERRSIEAHYRPRADNAFGVDVAPFDTARTLVIDPAVEYGSFLGGSMPEGAGAIVGAHDGSVWVVGRTFSDDFPLANEDPGLPTGADSGTVSRIGPAGLLFSTYLGGNGTDAATAVALGIGGVAHVAGWTESTDFPTTTGNMLFGTRDAFAATFDTDGTLLFSRYVGGTGIDEATGIAADASGGVYISGETASTTIIASAGTVQTTPAGGFDGFVARVTPGYLGTYLGGSQDDDTTDLCIRADGRIVVVGSTPSTDLTGTAGGLQTHAGNDDAYAVILSPDLASVEFGTYLGGMDVEGNTHCALDSQDDLILAGYTRSTDFPVSVGAFQTSLKGQLEGFVTRLSKLDNTVTFSTYFGGAESDGVWGLGVDSHGRATIAGVTRSSDLPSTEGSIPAILYDAVFAATLSPDGESLVSSSVIDGTDSGWPIGAVWEASVDTFNDHILFTSATGAATFPVTADAYQSSSADLRDLHVLVLAAVPEPNPPTLSLSTTTAEVGPGGDAIIEVTLSKSWETDVGVTLQVDGPGTMTLPTSVRIPKGEVQTSFAAWATEAGDYTVTGTLPAQLGAATGSVGVRVTIDPFTPGAPGCGWRGH